MSEPLTSKELAKFEAWVKALHLDLGRTMDGRYGDPFTNARWGAWQAAVAAHEPGTLRTGIQSFTLELTDQQVKSLTARGVAEIPAQDCKQCDQLIDDRDRCHDYADDLANAISLMTGVDIGEHSSGNNPWQQALDSAEEFTTRTASPPPVSQVDWLGLALDLEAQAKRVESQTVERTMTAAAHGLRLMGSAITKESAT